MIVERVRRWGGLTSSAVLDAVSKIFTIPTVDGLIGYRVESECAVVLGDPICAEKDIPELTHSFHQLCKEQNLSIVYISVSQQFASWLKLEQGFASLEF